MSFPCQVCGTPLVHARRRDLIYEATGSFSTVAYLFPQVYCATCRRQVPESEWPEGLRRRIRSFRLKWVLFAIGLGLVVVYRIYARDLGDWFRKRMAARPGPEAGARICANSGDQIGDNPY